MKAVLLAAGQGSRLRPLTDQIPKVMIPFKGKPVLERHIEQLAESNIREIYINLHHLPKKIRGYFGTGKKWKVKIKYSYEPIILGTAGAVKNLENELIKEPFLVVYGDNILETNYLDFVKYAEQKKGLGIVAVFNKEDVLASGILDIDQENRIMHFVEKPAVDRVFSHWVNAGLYYLRPEIFKYLSEGNSDFGYDIIPKILAAGDFLYAYKMTSAVLAIDSPDLLAYVLKHNDMHKNKDAAEAKRKP